MDKPKIDLSRTELEFLKRLLLDLQHELGCTREASDEELVAAIELSLGMLQWDGNVPPPPDARFGTGRRRRPTPVH